jgi:hypothetical protein
LVPGGKHSGNWPLGSQRVGRSSQLKVRSAEKLSNSGVGHSAAAALLAKKVFFHVYNFFFIPSLFLTAEKTGKVRHTTPFIFRMYKLLSLWPKGCVI